MSKVSDQKSKALGAIAAVQTLLERYPVLVTVNNDGSDTSFGFMLNILKIIGVSEYQIIEWVANLLSGKVSDGILEEFKKRHKDMNVTATFFVMDGELLCSGITASSAILGVGASMTFGS